MWEEILVASTLLLSSCELLRREDGVGIELRVKLLLKIPQVVYLEIGVEFEARHEVPVANASHYGNDFDRQALVLYLEVVGDEGVVLKADSNHLAICADVEAKRLAVVVLALEGQRHLQSLQIEEPDVVIVARGNEEEDLVRAWIVLAADCLLALL